MYTPVLQGKSDSSGPNDQGAASAKAGLRAVLKQVKQYVTERNIDQAKLVLAKAIDQDPENSSFLLVMSKLHSISKDYKTASLYVQRAIKADPLNATALVQQGSILFSQGEYNQALEAVSSAFQVDTRSLKAYHLEQRTLIKTSNYSKLIESCDRCLSIYPFDNRSYLNKAKGLSSLGQIDKAEELIKTALVMVPRNKASSLHSGLASIYTTLGLTEKAIVAYQDSLSQQKTGSPKSILNLAKLFIDISEYDQSRQYLEQYESALRSLKRKSVAKKLKTIYQYTYDLTFASTLKGNSSPEPYQSAVTAILRRMILDSETLCGTSQPLSSDSLNTLQFTQIEKLVADAVPEFEKFKSQSTNDDSVVEDGSDDDLGDFLN